MGIFCDVALVSKCEASTEWMTDEIAVGATASAPAVEDGLSDPDVLQTRPKTESSFAEVPMINFSALCRSSGPEVKVSSRGSKPVASTLSGRALGCGGGDSSKGSSLRRGEPNNEGKDEFGVNTQTSTAKHSSVGIGVRRRVRRWSGGVDWSKGSSSNKGEQVSEGSDDVGDMSGDLKDISAEVKSRERWAASERKRANNASNRHSRRHRAVSMVSGPSKLSLHHTRLVHEAT